MVLAIDVGNTEAVIGVIGVGPRVDAHWRISTRVLRTADEYRHLLSSLLTGGGFQRGDLSVAVLGSVVPVATRALEGVLRDFVSDRVVVVTPDLDLPVILDVDEPRTVGADRIVNTLAAREMYGRDTIVVDLGTATTFDLITAAGAFQGGVISPGVSAGIDWLERRAAKLPSVELAAPAAVIGRNTEACIRSGVFYSAVDAIDGMIERIRGEWGRPDPYVVVTGGYAELLGRHCQRVDHIEPFLTLYGLGLAAQIS